MNKYRNREIIWRLLIVGTLTFFTIEMFFIPTNTYSKDPDWVLAYAASVIAGFIIQGKLYHYYYNIMASIILTDWLADEKIKKLLHLSQIKDFVDSSEHYTKLSKSSPQVILLKEYIDNKIEPDLIKLVIEKYYTDEALEDKKLENEAAYQELKNRIENKL